MWPILKTVLTIIKLGLFLLAIGLSIANINERYNSNKTTATSSIVDLASIEFPLKISVLINPGFSSEEIRNAGYRDGFYYFSGLSKFDHEKSHIGWAGHTADGGNVDNVTGRIEIKGVVKKNTAK